MSRIADALKNQSKEQMQKTVQDSYNRKDEKAWSYQTIFIKDKIPEGVDFWQPTIGEHEIDIIPFVAGKQHPQKKEGEVAHNIDIWVYQNIAYRSFVAPKANFDKPDPIFDYLSSSRGTVTKEQYKLIAPKRRIIYLVWVHDTIDEEKKGVQIWDVAHYFMGEPLEQAAKLPKGGGFELYFHPSQELGRRIYFEIQKSGQYEDSSGAQREGRDFTAPRLMARKQDIPDEILDQEFSLDEVIHMHPSEEEIHEAFYQRKLGEAETNDEEKTPIVPGKCPHGYRFGIDTSQMNECKKCVVWESCQEKYLSGPEGAGENEPVTMTSVEDSTPDTPETGETDKVETKPESAQPDTPPEVPDKTEETKEESVAHERVGRRRGRRRS